MKNKNIFSSFKYAFYGIYSVIKAERNMKIHFLMMLLVIAFGTYYQITSFEWLICLLCFGLVISMEMINTAIETTVDMVMPKKNEKAKIAKDAAAGGVLVAAIISAISGLIIFLPKILESFF